MLPIWSGQFVLRSLDGVPHHKWLLELYSEWGKVWESCIKLWIFLEEKTAEVSFEGLIWMIEDMSFKMTFMIDDTFSAFFNSVDAGLGSCSFLWNDGFHGVFDFFWWWWWFFLRFWSYSSIDVLIMYFFLELCHHQMHFEYTCIYEFLCKWFNHAGFRDRENITIPDTPQVVTIHKGLHLTSL